MDVNGQWMNNVADLGHVQPTTKEAIHDTTEKFNVFPDFVIFCEQRFNVRR
jgi:hypothetical protein